MSGQQPPGGSFVWNHQPFRVWASADGSHDPTKRQIKSRPKGSTTRRAKKNAKRKIADPDPSEYPSPPTSLSEDVVPLSPQAPASEAIPTITDIVPLHSTADRDTEGVPVDSVAAGFLEAFAAYSGVSIAEARRLLLGSPSPAAGVSIEPPMPLYWSNLGVQDQMFPVLPSAQEVVHLRTL
jgi:hypothetical protein